MPPEYVEANFPGRFVQLEQVERLDRTPAALRSAQVMEVGYQGEVLGARQQTIDRRELPRHPNRAPEPRPVADVRRDRQPAARRHQAGSA